MKINYFIVYFLIIYNKYPSPRWIEICNSSNKTYTFRHPFDFKILLISLVTSVVDFIHISGIKACNIDSTPPLKNR